MPKRYLCLPEYECHCHHHPGRPVCRSTMKRHRRDANERRGRNNLSPLPLGPEATGTSLSNVMDLFARYDESRVQDCGETPLQLPSNLRLNEFNGHSSSDVAPEGICALRRDEDNARNGVNISATATVPRTIAEEANLASTLPTRRQTERCANNENDECVDASYDHGEDFPEHHANEVTGDENVEEAVGASLQSLPEDTVEINLCEEDMEMEIALTKNYEFKHSDSSKNGSSQSNRNQQHLADSLSEDSSTSIRRYGIPRERFLSWCLNAEAWIRFGIETGQKGEHMDRILRILEAPYRTWSTVKSNLVKYSGLNTVKYLCCRNHELSEYEQSEFVHAKEDPNFCSVCSEVGSRPDFCDFDYLELRGRLIADMQSKKGFEKLYSYRHKRIEERERSHGAKEYSDFCDGQLYQKVVEKYGGEHCVKYDVFLAISSDGFQPFASSSEDVWPLVALNLNLDPLERFRARSIVPLGYTKGPRAPKRLDTFFRPLCKEVERINENGGMTVKCYDNVSRRVRVHIMWFSGDLPAVAKAACTNGTNGTYACTHCMVKGVWQRESNHNYFPSAMLEEGRRRRLVTFFDIGNPRLRTIEETRQTMQTLQEANLSKSRRNKIIRDSGIQRESTLLRLPSMLPFESFPVDCMHLVMNVAKDMLRLLKNENKHVLQATRNSESVDAFVIPSQTWTHIDADLDRVGNGTSRDAFGPRPRATDCYTTWKAAECKEFLHSYCLIVFHGRLAGKYLDGFAHLSALVDLICRPQLSSQDVDDIGTHSRAFLSHYERDYYGYGMDRVGLCKFTFHILCHLQMHVRNVGPLLNCSQFYVERYIGFIKHRLHARNLAAASLTENSRISEAFKLVFNDSLLFFDRVEAEGNDVEEDEGALFWENEVDGTSAQPTRMLGRGIHESYSSTWSTKMRIMPLMINFISSTYGMEGEEAEECIKDNEFLRYERLQTSCGAGSQKISTKDSVQRKGKRADCYIAAEFKRDDMEGSVMRMDVYYGRVLWFLECGLRVDGNNVTQKLVLAEWADRLKLTRQEAVYVPSGLREAFLHPTLSDIECILNQVGVLERIEGKRNRKARTYIINRLHRAHHLLDDSRPSMDGVYRYLACLDT